MKYSNKKIEKQKNRKTKNKKIEKSEEEPNSICLLYYKKNILQLLIILMN